MALFCSVYIYNILFSCFRLGETGYPLCAGQEGGHKDCQQGEAQRECPTKGIAQ
jgi:hypothetical protein